MATLSPMRLVWASIDSMKVTLTALFLPAIAFALIAPSTGAQEPPPRPRGGPSQAAVKAAADKRAEMKDKAADKRAEAADKREAAADKRAERKEDRAEVREAWKKLKETRKERRKERREEIKKLWGDLSDKPAARAELRVHAWRVARLNRMRTIAKAEGKDAMVTRIDGLLEKEKARHKKKMEQLKDKGGAK